MGEGTLSDKPDTSDPGSVTVKVSPFGGLSLELKHPLLRLFTRIAAAVGAAVYLGLAIVKLLNLDGGLVHLDRYGADGSRSDIVYVASHRIIQASDRPLFVACGAAADLAVQDLEIIDYQLAGHQHCRAFKSSVSLPPGIALSARGLAGATLHSERVRTVSAAGFFDILRLLMYATYFFLAIAAIAPFETLERRMPGPDSGPAFEWAQPLTAWAYVGISVVLLKLPNVDLFPTAFPDSEPARIAALVLAVLTAVFLSVPAAFLICIVRKQIWRAIGGQWPLKVAAALISVPVAIGFLAFFGAAMLLLFSIMQFIAYMFVGKNLFGLFVLGMM